MKHEEAMQILQMYKDEMGQRIDPDKYVKKRDVIKLLTRAAMGNRKALIESIKEL